MCYCKWPNEDLSRQKPLYFPKNRNNYCPYKAGMFFMEDFYVLSSRSIKIMNSNTSIWLHSRCAQGAVAIMTWGDKRKNVLQSFIDPKPASLYAEIAPPRTAWLRILLPPFPCMLFRDRQASSRWQQSPLRTDRF